MQSAALLKSLISFDTVSKNPNKELIEYIADLFNASGITCEIIPDATGGKANLYATIGPQDKSGIMLSGHTDVVPIEGQAWKNHRLN